MIYQPLCTCCGEETDRELLRASPFGCGGPWCQQCLTEWDRETERQAAEAARHERAARREDSRAGGFYYPETHDWRDS